MCMPFLVFQGSVRWHALLLLASVHQPSFRSLFSPSSVPNYLEEPLCDLPLGIRGDFFEHHIVSFPGVVIGTGQ